MIGGPPPPAAPKSDHALRPAVPPEVAGHQTTSLQMWSSHPQSTPPENLTQMSRNRRPKIARLGGGLERGVASCCGEAR
jgi:hypothetical protein